MVLSEAQLEPVADDALLRFAQDYRIAAE